MKAIKLRRTIASLCLIGTVITGVFVPAAVNVPAVMAATGSKTLEDVVKEYGTCNYVIELKTIGIPNNEEIPFVFEPSNFRTVYDDNGNCLLYGKYGDVFFDKDSDGVNNGYSLFYLKNGQSVNIKDIPINGYDSYSVIDTGWKYFAEVYNVHYDKGYAFCYSGSDLSYQNVGLFKANTRRQGMTSKMTITAIKVDNIYLSDTNISVVKGGSNGIRTFADADKKYEIDQDHVSLEYISSNTAVATVNKYGGIEGISPGESVITSIFHTPSGDKTAKCKVTVSEETIAVTGVELNKTSAELKKDESITLVPTVIPNNARNKIVSWTSSNTSVATVKNGMVKAVGAGTATITAKISDGDKTASCKITVTENKPSTVAVTGISLDKNTMSIKKGASGSLTATVSPSNATNKKVTWTSSNTSVATINNGTVNAVGTGTATITARTADGGKTASCKVTVTEDKPATVSVTGVSLNKTSLSLKKGASEVLTATVSPSNATNKKVTWTSSNTSVATVSNGVIKGLKAGTATIAAKTEDGGKTASCKVTVTNEITNNTSTVKQGWVHENGAWYYYKDNKYYTGWHWMTNNEGEKTPHWSYFGNDGKIRTGWIRFGRGTSEPDGNSAIHWSYFGDNGWLRTGWQEMGQGTNNPDGNHERHWSHFGNNGWLRTGWINTDGKWRFCDNRGWAYTGWHTMSEKEGESITHISYFDKTGILLLGQQVIGGKEYTFDSRGWLRD